MTIEIIEQFDAQDGTKDVIATWHDWTFAPTPGIHVIVNGHKRLVLETVVSEDGQSATLTVR